MLLGILVLFFFTVVVPVLVLSYRCWPLNLSDQPCQVQNNPSIIIGAVIGIITTALFFGLVEYRLDRAQKESRANENFMLGVDAEDKADFSGAKDFFGQAFDLWKEGGSAEDKENAARAALKQGNCLEQEKADGWKEEAVTCYENAVKFGKDSHTKGGKDHARTAEDRRKLLLKPPPSIVPSGVTLDRYSRWFDELFRLWEDNWRELPSGKVKSVHEQMVKSKPGLAEPEGGMVKWLPLTFYPSITLMRVNEAKTGPIWFLGRLDGLSVHDQVSSLDGTRVPREHKAAIQDQMFLLDGTSNPIHTANQVDSIRITEANVLPYLKFFCYFVHGPEGPFLIAEDIEHPALGGVRLKDPKRRMIAQKLRRPVLEGKTLDGAFEVRATVLYGSALYVAHFSVWEDGKVIMLDDEPIAADLPIEKVKPNY